MVQFFLLNRGRLFISKEVVLSLSFLNFCFICTVNSKQISSLELPMMGYDPQINGEGSDLRATATAQVVVTKNFGRKSRKSIARIGHFWCNEQLE